MSELRDASGLKTREGGAHRRWPAHLVTEMRENANNGCVGTVLVSETDRVRVWHLNLGPGERCPFHRHVNDYFWTVHSSGRVRSYDESGRVSVADYQTGMTRHYKFSAGGYLLHSIENIGDGMLTFTTVEFVDGPNKPLRLPDSIRFVPAA